MILMILICHHQHVISTDLYYADHHLHQAPPSAGQARLTAEQERDDINYITGLQLATR